MWQLIGIVSDSEPTAGVWHSVVVAEFSVETWAKRYLESAKLPTFQQVSDSDCLTVQPGQQFKTHSLLAGCFQAYVRHKVPVPLDPREL